MAGHCDFDEMVHASSHTWLLLRLLGPRSYLTASPTISAHEFPVCVPKAVPASIYMFFKLPTSLKLKVFPVHDL